MINSADKPLVESFALDHERVIAPYVRLAAVYRLSPEDTPVQKYDVRFSQPNHEFMETGVLHTLEHLLAVGLRQSPIGPGVIDISPMGCRTGFYLIVRGDYNEESIAESIVQGLTDVQQISDLSQVPGRAKEQCGNWLDHNLDGAKVWAKRWLEGIEKKGIKAFPEEG